MSYCPKCGVELAPSESACPLCGTAVSTAQASEPLYPTDGGTMPRVCEQTPRKRRTFAAVCAILLLIPVLTCVVSDLNIDGCFTWSRYVLASFALFYALLFPPMLLLRHRLVVSGALDFLGIAGFLFAIERFGGGNWYLRFALPLTALLAIVFALVMLMIRRSRWNFLKILSAVLLGMGVCVVLLEWLINRSFFPTRSMTWAVYTCIPCLLLGAALLVLDGNPACKQELRKRFFF